MSAEQALVSYRDDMIDAVRDAGTQAALVFDPAWRDRAAAAIEELAASSRAFTAEDVRHLAGEPDSPNALGAALLTASKSGVIEAVGFAKSTRISRHGAWLRTWRRRLPDRGGQA